MFDFYDGGGLDVCYLGAAEVDRKGNVNVSKFKKTVGPGGFINIAQTTHNMFFCGTLTAGGLKTAVKDHKLIIVNEGRNKKFVNQVQQITFSGDYALETNQNILFTFIFFGLITTATIHPINKAIIRAQLFIVPRIPVLVILYGACVAHNDISQLGKTPFCRSKLTPKTSTKGINESQIDGKLELSSDSGSSLWPVP